MIEREELIELSSIQSQEHPVLSVYLDTSPSQSEGKVYRLVLKELLREFESRIDNRKEKRQFAKEAAKTVSFVESELKPEGKCIVLFSCDKIGLWQVMHLPVDVPNVVRFQSSPYSKPLMSILSTYEKQCVVLVDKGRARLFFIQMGEIEEYSESSNTIPTKHKQGGLSQANFQRRHNTHVHWHLKDVVDQLSAHNEKGTFDRLILAGPEETLANIQRLLPKALQEKLGGVFSASLNASASNILNGASALLSDIEKSTKQSLVATAINLARQGGPAVLGVKDTLAALQEGRIYSLIVTENFSTGGYVCNGCSYLSVIHKDNCPHCGEDLVETQDVIDRAVSLTWQKEGRVETIRDEAAQSLIRATGDGIAGIVWF